MRIEFPNKEVVNSATGGINFPVIVDDNQVTCRVSKEALEDIDPENRINSVEQQFSENRTILEDIVRKKIENADEDLFITSSDISSKNI